MLHILVVEDDINIRKLMCEYIKKSGYIPLWADDGIQALKIIDTEKVDLMVTDIMLPGINGFELTETIRMMSSNMPILIVTAKEEFKDKKIGFSCGADDYMVKPIDMNEMVLRIQALIRRANIKASKKIVIGETIMDYESYSIKIKGKEIVLAKKEFEILFLLLSYTNKIFSRKHILDKIWGRAADSIERTVDVHINRIREKIGECEDVEIITVKGLGYKAVRRDEKE